MHRKKRKFLAVDSNRSHPLLLLEEFGIKKVMNAWGTVTVLRGTTLSDRVIEAMREASKVYVDMKQLPEKAGDLIARMTGVESACISSGATAGLVLAAAACITNGDREEILALLSADQSSNKVVIQRLHHNAFVNILRLAGGGHSRSRGEKRLRSRILETHWMNRSPW